MYTSCVVVTGRAVTEPQLRQGKEKPYVKYKIAIPRPFGIKQDTDFFTVCAWNNTAKTICRYIRKGQLHTVQGVLRESKYRDAYTGREIRDVSIVAEKITPYERDMYRPKTMADVEADLKKAPEEVMASLEQGLDDMRAESEEVFGARSIESAIKAEEVNVMDEDIPR